MPSYNLRSREKREKLLRQSSYTLNGVSNEKVFTVHSNSVIQKLENKKVLELSSTLTETVSIDVSGEDTRSSLGLTQNRRYNLRIRKLSDGKYSEKAKVVRASSMYVKKSQRPLKAKINDTQKSVVNGVGISPDNSFRSAKKVKMNEKPLPAKIVNGVKECNNNSYSNGTKRPGNNHRRRLEIFSTESSSETDDYEDGVQTRARLQQPKKKQKLRQSSTKELSKFDYKREPISKFQIARTKLDSLCTKQNSLPCREENFKIVQNFIDTRLRDQKSGCLYIHGVPGTGKTATLKLVVHAANWNIEMDRCRLKFLMSSKSKSFDYVYLNAMRLTKPNLAYTAICKELVGSVFSERRALQYLRDHFSSSRSIPCLLVLDELDYLYNRTQTVFYNLFDWSRAPESKLILIAIANTMDLPERLMSNKVKSRMGCERLNFSPYTSKELHEIINVKLSETRVFTEDAIQFAAKKVAAVCGDLRRAISVCKIATELAEKRSPKDGFVQLEHMTEAVSDTFACPLMGGLKVMSNADMAVMKVICLEINRFQGTGKEVITKGILEAVKDERAALISIRRLSACGLIYTDQNESNFLIRAIRLPMSAEDILASICEQKFVK